MPESGGEYGLGVDGRGQVVERVLGERLDAVLAARLFQPLAMADTAFAPTPSMRACGASMRQRGRKAGPELTTCQPGQVWDAKKRKMSPAAQRRSSGFRVPNTLYALAKADRFQEAIDVLELRSRIPTRRALNYRGYATRKL